MQWLVCVDYRSVIGFFKSQVRPHLYAGKCQCKSCVHVRGYKNNSNTTDLHTDAVAKGVPRSILPRYATLRIQKRRDVKVKVMYLASIWKEGETVHDSHPCDTEKEAYAVAAERVWRILLTKVQSEDAALFKTEVARASEQNDPETALRFLNMKRPEIVKGDVTKILVPILGLSR